LRSLLIAAIGYLIGSIPFGYLIVRTKEGSDIRHSGSGGTGATNVSRRAGKAAGIITLVLDALKGAFAVLLAVLLVPDSTPTADWTIAVAAVLAIVGHIFPVWLSFQGGKGVATYLGVFFMFAPYIVALALLIFVVTFVLTRYVSLASIIFTTSVALTMSVVVIFFPRAPSEVVPGAAAAVVSAALIIFAHRANIRRLMAGTEPKFR
jgi:acyl phosphate:glycerol-3-phosphate acyltransferase